MASRKVVKEFLGKIIRAVGKKKGQADAKKLLQSPEIKKLAEQSAKLANDIEKKLEKDAAGGDKKAGQLLGLLKDLD